MAMIDLPLDIEDRAAYPLIAQSERWIFNKLILAEKLGYRCGPAGTPITVAGDYCYRPIMNCAGRGLGGVLRHDAVDDSHGFERLFRRGGLTQPPFAAGYFWCEWFDGYHEWVDFTDDLPVLWSGGDEVNGRIEYGYDSAAPMVGTLPLLLQGFSKYLLIETIGKNIIEVSPRHQIFQGATPTAASMEKYEPVAPWGNDSDTWKSFYWRVLPPG